MLATLLHALLVSQALAWGGDARETGFEALPAGPFTEIATELGAFRATEGPALVEEGHARTGKRCLQLAGPRSVVELEFAEAPAAGAVLSFHAERWTARGPFAFTIDSFDGAEWKPLHDGTRTVVVGRGYRSVVKIPLDGPGARRLRFTVESPAGTGVLIDDMRLAPPAPQRVVSIAPIDEELPVLVGRASSPLARIAIAAEGTLEPLAVREVRVSLEGTTDRRDLVALVVRSGPSWDDPAAKTIGEAAVAQAGAQTIALRAASHALDDGANQLWIGCRLAPRADIDHRIAIDLESITLSDGSRVAVDMAPAVRRLGIALRQQGDDGIHTARIPGLATTNAGTLLAVYDNRRTGGYDLPSDIDVGLSRSTDGGRSWEPMRVVMDMGDDPKWRHDGIGDPSILVDRTTGTIWIAALWSHGDRGWNGSGPGLTPEETGQFVLVRSDDDGVSWSKPVNITDSVKDPAWSLFLQGPGKGITMSDGTLVFPAQFRSSPETGKVPHSTILWSKDGGRTWKAGTGAFPHTTEAQVVEVAPGELMLNCRYDMEPARVVMTTKDLGGSWSVHPSSRRALVEPGACMASLVDIDRELGRAPRGRLLFSNPDATDVRRRITIKASDDGGSNWPEDRRVLLDSGRSAGYSCLTMIDDATIGILYESSQAHLAFQRVALADLLPGRGAFRFGRGIGTGMVVQADRPFVAHGTGMPGTGVECAFAGVRRETTVGDDGRWRVEFPARSASSEPLSLAARAAGETLTADDILVGEVWICAGQSNMEWPVRRAARADEALAGPIPGAIRLFDAQPGAWTHPAPYGAAELARLAPARFFDGAWCRADRASVAEVSAVGWWFARRLHEALGVPVGIVDLAVGGSPTEAWIPADALAASDEWRPLVEGRWTANARLTDFCRRRGNENLAARLVEGAQVPGDATGPNHPFKPGFLWSAGLEPMRPFGCRGILWYQGESNAESLDRAVEQRALMATLVDAWRERLDDADLPILFVQLPAMDRAAWPAFRESQRRLLEDRDGLAMAVTIDTGFRNDVHPPLKQPVGERLAALALAEVYGREVASARGPTVAKVVEAKGAIEVTFSHVAGGLATSDGAPVRHLEILGDDGAWHPATGTMRGRSVLRIESPEVPEPRFARYAWRPFPDPPANLVDSNGHPASPFTTAPRYER